MNPATRAFVCGFGDVQAGLGGLAWDLGEPGALLLKDGEVRQASFALEQDLDTTTDTTTIEVTADDDIVEATLAPQRTLIDHPDADNSVEFKSTAALAEVRLKGGTQTVRSAGQISEWVGDPLHGAAVVRHLAIGGGPDSLLVATATGSPGAEGHDNERALGWLLTPDSGAAYDETLISTQYDGDGLPTRIGLELWPEDADQTSRAAATRVSGSLLGGHAFGPLWAGLFRCHTDGTEGLGSYLLWRA
jgi:hypothetical protein